MNTLQAEQDLIDIFVNALNENTSQNVQVISARDFSEKRKDLVVSVGIDGFTNVNPMLPDYSYSVNILIDGFIKDDKEGFDFQNAKKEVFNFLEPYLMDKTKLPELFSGFPVVGMFLNNVSNATNDTSNQTIITLQVIASFG